MYLVNSQNSLKSIYPLLSLSNCLNISPNASLSGSNDDKFGISLGIFPRLGILAFLNPGMFGHPGIVTPPIEYPGMLGIPGIFGIDPILMWSGLMLLIALPAASSPLLMPFPIPLTAALAPAPTALPAALAPALVSSQALPIAPLASPMAPETLEPMAKWGRPNTLFLNIMLLYLFKIFINSLTLAFSKQPTCTPTTSTFL
mmetsp:Transcript_7398/g.6925  ORF Transcript_7398/g.6925 Transcript_7398/m.6925 type:complete len:201 (-) Transcript_7398:327-929(-)